MLIKENPSSAETCTSLLNTTEQKLDCLQGMEVNKTNKKPQVSRIRSLGKTSQQDEVVNTEVRLKANWLDKNYTM